jgi:hypothetical protein
MAIMAIIAVATYGVFAALTRSYTSQNVAADVQQNLRVSLDHMLQDVRVAGLDPLQRANAGIVYADAFKLHFTADRNMDGDTLDSGEDITYEVLDGIITITDDQGVLNIQDRIVDFAFRYFDRDDVETTDADEIRSVEISMTVQAPAGRAAPILRTYNTRVRCRNLGI